MTEYKTKSRSILTRFYGRYVNNDDLQKILRSDAKKARLDNDWSLHDYLIHFAENLEKLKD